MKLFAILAVMLSLSGCLGTGYIDVPDYHGSGGRR